MAVSAAVAAKAKGQRAVQRQVGPTTSAGAWLSHKPAAAQQHFSSTQTSYTHTHKEGNTGCMPSYAQPVNTAYHLPYCHSISPCHPRKDAVRPPPTPL